MTGKSKPLADVLDNAVQEMYDFCEDHKLKAGLGAGVLIALVLVGSWNIGQDWRMYGRRYQVYDGVLVEGEVTLGVRTIDNLVLLGFLWVFIAVPAAFLADHIGFVQWVLMNWEPLPPNPIEENPSD